MKNFTKTKMFSLIAAVILFVVLVGATVPITLAYFNKRDNFGGETTAPHTEAYIEASGMSVKTIGSSQYYVSTNSFNGSTPLTDVSAKVKVTNNIPVVLRVKITLKLSPTNSPTAINNLPPINNNFTIGVAENEWTLGADGKDITSAADVSTYHLYYNEEISAGINKEIDIFTSINQNSGTTFYNGKYLVAEFYCETLSKTEVFEKEWLSAGDLTGWQANWHGKIF